MSTKRRHFLTKSVVASSLAYGFDGGDSPMLAQPAEQNLAAPSEGIARFEELNKALDWGAMQRGWATPVDPSYHHAPQAAFAWDPFDQYYDPHFTPQSDPARWQTFTAHEREQVRELMAEYGRSV